jgi:glycosyltransferase involved in cell wall biosynthesis
LGAWYVREQRRNPLMPPVVVSVYGLESRAFESRIATAKWLGRPIGFLSKLGAKSVVWQANYSLKYADHVIVETNEDKEWIVNNLKRRPESITIQTGGVNKVFFGNEQKNNTDIIFLGSWIERKGITVFSRVVNKLIEEGLGSKITIAGTGCPADEVIAHFSEKAKKFISVIPKLNSEAETADLLSKSGIFFFPSNFEGVPLSLLEAAASGCAILTTNNCGMKDFISDGINGFLCSNFDEKHFYNCLEYLVKNSHVRTKVGSEARCSAKRYTWDRSAEQFISACSSAFKGNKKYIDR